MAPDIERLTVSEPKRAIAPVSMMPKRFIMGYTSGNLWLSYEQGVPDAVVCPDSEG